MVLSVALMSCVFLPFRVGYLLAQVLYDIKNVTYPMHLNKYVRFLCSPKENERRVILPHHYRKGARSLGPSDFPALLDTAGNLQTRGVYARMGAQTMQIPVSAVSPVLGGMTMGPIKYLTRRVSQFFCKSTPTCYRLVH